MVLTQFPSHVKLTSDSRNLFIYSMVISVPNYLTVLSQVRYVKVLYMCMVKCNSDKTYDYIFFVCILRGKV